MTLVHRSFVKSYRDVVAYGIRIAMYTGLAIMMGTVWLRLHTEQADIQPFINAIVRARFWGFNAGTNLILVLWLSIHVLHGSSLRPLLP